MNWINTAETVFKTLKEKLKKFPQAVTLLKIFDDLLQPCTYPRV